MPFTQETFTPIGGVATEAPTVFSYSTNDLFSEVISQGYFSEKKLYENDVIHLFSSDRDTILRVGPGDTLIDLLGTIFTVVTTADSLTSGSGQVVICKNTASINITLNTTPALGERVYIKRKDAEVVVIGQIDGVTNKTINVQNYAMHLIYDGTEWSEI